MRYTWCQNIWFMEARKGALVYVQRTPPPDLTDRQWDYSKDFIPAAKATGHPRKLDMPQMVNALFSILVPSPTPTPQRSPAPPLPHSPTPPPTGCALRWKKLTNSPLVKGKQDARLSRIPALILPSIRGILHGNRIPELLIPIRIKAFSARSLRISWAPLQRSNAPTLQRSNAPTLQRSNAPTLPLAEPPPLCYTPSHRISPTHGASNTRFGWIVAFHYGDTEVPREQIFFFSLPESWRSLCLGGSIPIDPNIVSLV
jgi:hypothetical protein